MNSRQRSNLICLFLYGSLTAFVLMVIAVFTMLTNEEYMDDNVKLPEFRDRHTDRSYALKEDINQPIILWWTGFTSEPGRYRSCGKHKCFFTVDRHYTDHPQTKGFLFYGTDLRIIDLPIPRKPDHHWGLLHEESPKNNYILSHAEVLELFNHTSTFRRESDYPLPLQYIESKEWLETKKYLVPTAKKNQYLSELSPLMFTQSDCGTPSDRDNYLTMMMSYISVDSYGSCLHNKDLPKHLSEPLEGYEHDDFYRLTGKYKFTFAMENAVCNDYMTEKLWRPLMAGSVPIVYGSPRVRDYLPDNKSAILVDDFETVKDLVDHIKFLNENDDEYNKYLRWKETGITNKFLLESLKTRDYGIKNTFFSGETNFVEGFECFVCNRIHEYLKAGKTLRFQADASHYGCPVPKKFDSTGKLVDSDDWDAYEWKQTQYKAKAAKYFAEKNVPITKAELYAKVAELKNSKR